MHAFLKQVQRKVLEEDTAAAGADVLDDTAVDNMAAFAMDAMRGEGPHSPGNSGGLSR